MKQTVIALTAGALMTLALVAPCTIAHAQSQTEMNMEAADNFKKADTELNIVYKKLMAKLDKQGQAKLQKAQRAWITYRDAEMALAGDGARGGSMSPMLYSWAGTRVTKSRIKDLKMYIEERSNR
jgi:uncharacterized protein YecT (DUF1311 family)